MESVFWYHEDLQLSTWRPGQLWPPVFQRGEGKLENSLSYISLKSTLVTCNTEMQQIGAETKCQKLEDSFPFWATVRLIHLCSTGRLKFVWQVWTTDLGLSLVLQLQWKVNHF